MIVDLIILAILIIAVIVGRARGLTVCLVNIFSFVIALLVAFLLCKMVGNYLINNTKIDDNIKQTIKTNIPLNDTNFNIEGTSNLPKSIQTQINNTTNSATQTKDEAIETIASELTVEIINVISFIIVFIVVRALLLLLKILSKIITKLPILKQIDHLGGAICGFIEGIILVYFAFAIISMTSPVFEGTSVINQINKSFVGKQMYNNNYLANKFIKIK